MTIAGGRINRFRGKMSGNSKLWLMLCALLCDLAICGAGMDKTPKIHSIPLQNHTAIPEAYKNLTVVGKCCAEGEVFANLSERSCRAVNSSTDPIFSPRFSRFNRTGLLAPGKRQSTFVAIVGNPCKDKMYVLEPNESSIDANYLLINGSVFAPRLDQMMLQPGIDYCMDVIPELGLRTVVCFSEYRIIVTADSRITIYACGLLLSVPFLILTILAYSITPKLKDVFGKALSRYCGCLALAFIILAVTQLGNLHLSSETCNSIGFVIQFSFVACFFWLNAMCIEMWSLVRSHVDRDTYRRMKPKTLFFWYSLWCWGPSVILILVSMSMDLSPTIPATYVKSNFGKESCQFKSNDKSMPYFYLPVGLLLLGNVILFVLTFIKLTKYQKDLDLRRLARNQESDRLDRRFLRRFMRTTFVCLIIFFLMGLNWTMELISWFVHGNSIDWSTFDLVNSLQGVLVFGLFVLRRPPRDFVWQRVQQLRGMDVAEQESRSLELYLLPVMNGDSTPRQTIIP
ncbi:putative G-protein coupled receptor Mth-like 10 [Megachile rotundata]|uniref:putative G-protein coupled receptor Mth-like 10 n=1 Tax=Megachile rotundata TaxID=143995 RepID=UPI003FD4806C